MVYRTPSFSETIQPQDLAILILILASLPGYPPEKFIRNFIRDYTSQPSPLNSRLSPWELLEAHHVMCQLHLRSFSTISAARESRENASASGFHIACNRYSAPDLGIVERRRSLAVLLPVTTNLAWTPWKRLENGYVILKLTGYSIHKILEVPEIRLCLPATGIAMFQRVVWTEVDKWTQDWRDVLGQINHLVSFKVIPWQACNLVLYSHVADDF